MGGDFNSKELAERMAGQGLLWATRDIGHTWKMFTADHILARGLIPVGEPNAGWRARSTGPSDHSAAWVTFAARKD